MMALIRLARRPIHLREVPADGEVEPFAVAGPHAKSICFATILGSRVPTDRSRAPAQRPQHYRGSDLTGIR